MSVTNLENLLSSTKFVAFLEVWKGGEAAHVGSDIVAEYFSRAGAEAETMNEPSKFS